ncbi:hypothetical protein EV378_4872 [Pseudonocardia endophytica]|uniref:Uncharacterized protein n=1 Tax=Pseudonocardia endophytica TaxID=401976 RepID=A0A4V2PHI5_PSEEN|nr:hypothetical protein EV378_4872 [Pseudonocardia endophytica]
MDGGGLAQELWSGVEQGQSNRTDQRNVNVAPVVQVAPTIDADGLLGRDGGDVRPDNRIDNRTIQENRNETVQHQFGCTRGG